MTWFKVHAEIIHDPKIRALAFEDRWHFVALMALMCDGTLEEPEDFRDELVSVALGLRGIDLEKAKARLMRLRLIGEDWKPRQWEKRQASSDPTAAERMRRYRENNILKKKEFADVTRNVTGDVTEKLRVEEEEEEEKEKINGDDYAADFLAFWDAWPGKDPKGSKAQAYAEWRKLKKPSPDDLLKAAQVQAREKQAAKLNGEFSAPFKHVCRWLKGREWENDSSLITSPEILTAPRVSRAMGSWR